LGLREITEMTAQETFVTRLRRHRQRNRISLEEIAADTRVKPELLEALEKNDLSEWPRGVYARAWIRAYAAAVGLDPMDTVDEFCRLFPQGDRRVRSTIEEIAAIVAQPSEYETDIAPELDRRRRSSEINVMRKAAWHATAKAAVASAGRTLWTCAAGVVTSPHNRKRQPRTS
jgi:transcriptional regulator with XRE-family HTH domain